MDDIERELDRMIVLLENIKSDLNQFYRALNQMSEYLKNARRNVSNKS